MQELCLVVQPGRHHSTQHCANGEFMLEYAKGYAGIGSVSATARRVRSQQHQRFVLHVQKAAFESPYAEGAASVTMYIVHRCTFLRYFRYVRYLPTCTFPGDPFISILDSCGRRVAHVVQPSGTATPILLRKREHHSWLGVSCHGRRAPWRVDVLDSLVCPSSF
jgi:hypothetical protein